MMTIQDRKLLRKGLKHGTGKKIADEIGVTKCAVAQWFSCKTNSQKIEDAVFAEFIKQKEERENKLKSVGLL
jgi:predicted transcriptional regulator